MSETTKNKNSKKLSVLNDYIKPDMFKSESRTTLREEMKV